MDPDKVLKFFSENLADWSYVTLLTLANPIRRFELTTFSGERTQTLVGIQSERALWLNPRLLAFAALSVVLGITMNSLLPNRIAGPPLLSTVAVVLVWWLLYGSLLHFICWLFRGSGRYLETLSVSIQVFATLYVVASFLSLLVAIAVSVPFVARVVGELPLVGQLLVYEPALFFFLINTVMLSIYVPLSLRPVHKFGWFRTAVIFSIPYLMVWASVVMYHKTGIMMAPPPL